MFNIIKRNFNIFNNMLENAIYYIAFYFQKDIKKINKNNNFRKEFKL